MSQYKVTSSRLGGFDFGATVSDADLAGFNIDALIEGGHLEPATKTKTTTTEIKES